VIILCYRLLCGVIAALALWGLVGPGKRQAKAVMAMLLVPFVLRALLVK
jgi:hypothetical protein